jgi:hypothetical protein
VYLQQFTDADGSINATSVAVRLTEKASCKQLTELLRQKLKLPPLKTRDQALKIENEYTTPLDRINAKLGRTVENVKYDPFKHDALVLVASYAMPKTYIGFEHEINKETSVTTESFNLFRTVLPHENPLIIRDNLVKKMSDMIEDAEFISASSCSTWKSTSGSPSRSPIRGARNQPAIRLFFMPCYHSGVSNATIDIEGYCSGVDSESDEDVDTCVDLVEDEKMMRLNKEQDLSFLLSADDSALINDYSLNKISKREKVLYRERHRMMVLSNIEATSEDAICGYLIRQSSDSNIWKRVYCVLTNNQFWFVSRVHHIKHLGPGIEDCPVTANRIGKHRIIDLDGTLLNELIDEQNPLSGIPFSFELNTKDGKTHVFRANSRHSYEKWMHCLSERIINCQENSYFELAESMIRQHSKRMAKKDLGEQ